MDMLFKILTAAMITLSAMWSQGNAERVVTSPTVSPLPSPTLIIEMPDLPAVEAFELTQAEETSTDQTCTDRGY